MAEVTMSGDVRDPRSIFTLHRQNALNPIDLPLCTYAQLFDRRQGPIPCHGLYGYGWGIGDWGCFGLGDRAWHGAMGRWRLVMVDGAWHGACLVIVVILELVVSTIQPAVSVSVTHERRRVEMRDYNLQGTY